MEYLATSDGHLSSSNTSTDPQVTCNKNPTYENSLWYIETNIHAQRKSFWMSAIVHSPLCSAHNLVPPDAEKVNYKRPSFFEKFFELQAVMWRTNAGLTDRHAYDSRPQSWPVLRRGIVSSLYCRYRGGKGTLGLRWQTSRKVRIFGS